MQNTDYNYLIKMVCLGDSAVGKSSIIQRFICNTCILPPPSIGTDFQKKITKIGGQMILSQIFDTPGSERIRAFTGPCSYRGKHGLIFIYDITSRESFLNVAQYLTRAKPTITSQTQLLLLGNKSDLEIHRQVTTQEGANFAIQNGMNFVEVSALSGTNVEVSIQNQIASIYNSGNANKNNSKFSQSLRPQQRYNCF